MIEIDADLSRVYARIDTMIDRISSFGSTVMPSELMAWQVDDIHRRYPKVSTPDATTAEMTIETHVQHVTVHSSRTGRRSVHAIQRPVLRPELIVKLHERMAERMQEEMTWR
jgi:hypothetical protein